ncbi:MAG: dihydrodipicolinate synthase family protein [Opitutaceae bacterium]
MTSHRLHRSEPHLIAALITPLTSDGGVDAPSLTRLVTYLQQHGIDEFFVLGSTGESPLLDRRERLAIVETVRRASPGSLVYAGISGTGHRHAIRNARECAEAGADVAVLMSPYFIALGQDHLVDYSRAVADDSPVPVALYHHLRMPTPFAVPTVTRLAAHPNIVAIKDTAGANANRCAEIVAATRGHSFLFLQGVEKLALPALAAGGHGCVVAQACIAPWLFRSLFDAWQAGERAQARELQQQIDALWEIFSKREVRQSFFHFLHTLKLPLKQRGVIESTAAAVPHVTFESAFEEMITSFMRRHLAAEPAIRAP